MRKISRGAAMRGLLEGSRERTLRGDTRRGCHEGTPPGAQTAPAGQHSHASCFTTLAQLPAPGPGGWAPGLLPRQWALSCLPSPVKVGGTCPPLAK